VQECPQNGHDGFRIPVRQDLFLALDQAGVPCGPINSIADDMALAAEAAYHSPPAELGEHGDAIREWLATTAR
jgi:hypothetical protein